MKWFLYVVRINNREASKMCIKANKFIERKPEED